MNGDTLLHSQAEAAIVLQALPLLPVAWVLAREGRPVVRFLYTPLEVIRNKVTGLSITGRGGSTGILTCPVGILCCRYLFSLSFPFSSVLLSARCVGALSLS